MKDLIADQIPILEVAIDIHRYRVPENLKMLHKHLEDCFIRMKSNVESKYGKKTTDLRDDPDRDSGVVLRRGNMNPLLSSELDRLSGASMGSSE